MPEEGDQNQLTATDYLQIGVIALTRALILADSGDLACPFDITITEAEEDLIFQGRLEKPEGSRPRLVSELEHRPTFELLARFPVTISFVDGTGKCYRFEVATAEVRQ
jgi:hypothetical protein